MTNPTRQRCLGALLLLAALVPALWFAHRHATLPHFGLFHDDAFYFSTARQWAVNGEHRTGMLVGNPWQTKYPPGHPLWLSMAWRIRPQFPDNLGVVVWMGLLTLAAVGVLAAASFRQWGIEWPWNFVLAAVMVANPYSIFYACSAMSDAPFLCLLLATALCATRGWVLAAGLLAAGCYMFRTTSFLLLAAGPLWFVLRRRVRDAAVFAAPLLLAMVAWQWWVVAHRAPGIDPQAIYYTDYFGFYRANFAWHELPAVIEANVQALIVSIGRLLWFDLGQGLWSLYGKSLLALLAVAGAWRLGLSLYAIYSLLYCALLLPWNATPYERFLLPVFPLLLAGLWASLRAIADALRRLWATRKMAERGAAVMAACALVVAAALWLMATAVGVREDMPALAARESARVAAERPVYEWAARNLPKGSSAMAYHEGRFHLYTGLQGYGMPLPSRIGYFGSRADVYNYFATLVDVARRHNVRYYFATDWDFDLVLNDDERARRQAAIARDTALREIHREGAVAIYEIASR